MTPCDEQLYVRALSRHAESRTDWPYPSAPVLTGHVTTLEVLSLETHSDPLWQTLSSETGAFDIWDYLPYGPFADRAAFDGYLAHLHQADNIMVYVIRRNDTGHCVGIATYLEIYPKHGAIEIGHIWFGAPLRQHVSGTDALFTMARHAMIDLGYRRLVWKCNAVNAKSHQMARRLGYRLEGIFHNHMVVKGHNRDTAWYAITEPEWPECQQLIQSWIESTAETGTPPYSLSQAMNARS